MRIAVIGLGKLGSPLAAVLAGAGHDVAGVDRDERTVELVGAGLAPVEEPGLSTLLLAGHDAGRLAATSDGARAAREADVIFVVVPTPSDADGGFSLDAVVSAMEDVGRGIRDHDGFPVVVLTSTVLPGATEGTVLPVLERASGKR